MIILAIANIIIKRGGRVLLTDIKTEVNLEDYIGTHRSVASVFSNKYCPKQMIFVCSLQQDEKSHKPEW